MSAITAAVQQSQNILPPENQKGVETQTCGKTHKIGLAAILGVILLTVIIIAATGGIGAAVGTVVVAAVSSSAIIAIGIGAAAAAITGLILTPLVISEIKKCLNRKVSQELFDPIDQTIEAKKIVTENGYSKNDCFITDDAEESLEQKLNMLRKAKHSIEISANYFGGKVLNDVLDIIEERMEACPDLQVHIIANPDFIEKKDEKRLAQLNKNENFHILITTPQLELSPKFSVCENHVKAVIVDEKYFVCGGSSLHDFLCAKGEEPPTRPKNQNFLEKHFLAGAARDHDIVGKGPMATNMRLEFFKLFAVWEYKLNRKETELNFRYYDIPEDKAVVPSIDDSKKLVEEAEIKFTISYPETGYNPCTAEYIRTIEQTQNRLLIGNMYYSPVKKLSESIDNAIEKKVNVKVLTNGVEDHLPIENYFFSFHGRQKHYDAQMRNEDSDLHEHQVQFYEYNVPDTLYHTKVLVSDEEAIIGSYNLGWRSHHTDNEAIISIRDRALVDQAVVVIGNDLLKAKSVTRKSARRYSKHIRSKFWSSLHKNIFKWIC